MQRLSAANIVSFINQLDKSITYNYIDARNKGLIEIINADLPEGPIRIKRWNPSKGESSVGKKIEPISSELIWRIANAFIPDQPINFDRVLAGSYNTRSVLEALLAYTPQFHFAYPGRIETNGGKAVIKQGHKHLIWTPDEPHTAGKIKEIKTQVVISELPAQEATYDALVLSSEPTIEPMIDIAIKRRHAQIQIALYFIGKQLNFRTWIAQNDKGIMYQNKKIGEFEGVISRLQDEKLLTAYQDAAKAALLIDCIWFKNGKLMPAVMEVEHSTGVTSGLTRMKKFKDLFIGLEDLRYVIVASDEDRAKVIKEANHPQFRDLNIRFFPYSAVEELYSLCQRRKIKGVTESFLDCYMEPVLVDQN
ncbi:hypothetical protein [Pedobacter cryoconitis]|uniref:Type II restriction enzyme n=1 Tax=Pedobacter cryoconitis TaxID=188932 RepID=A0A327RYY0_9SPHI|nr:hypothetical protein [Pedobacter cryoconitis]RAJ20994.1 type II restriction enzyme [Pedobacter cryoconitis]